MQIILRWFAILLLSILSSQTFAGWDKSCLDDCFKTGHDCKFCSYECYSEKNGHLMPNYSGDTACPLQNDDRQ